MIVFNAKINIFIIHKNNNAKNVAQNVLHVTKTHANNANKAIIYKISNAK
jgi:hypothetical protein